MSETQWAVEHVSSHGSSLGIIPQGDRDAARAVLVDCHEYGSPCRLLCRVVSDWSYAEEES